MRKLLLLLPVLLAACGPSYDRHLVIVRPYVYENGSLPPPENLGLTYFGREYNCLINEELATDDDPDRIVRVIIHELEDVLVIEDGVPDTAETTWYLYDSDTRPPFYPFPESEAAWLSQHHGHRVKIQADWLLEPTRAAMDRIEDACGVRMFWED